ncbi:MAG: cyclic nucleotide-binding domain-containing protein [Nitrospinae bacterium]|nr:cyclic nucleotide-binding domain-containing protein [Nitrospinota bacterium]
METKDLREILRKHPFVSDLSERHLQVLISCVANVRFTEGSYIFHEGEDANKFYLIRTGRVALEIHAGKKGILRVQTIGPGEVLGWSWLISPYRWHFDACAVEDVRAFTFDGKCLRTKCETDHDFGYEMIKRFSQVLEQNLKATRLQLLDVYGK